MRYDTVYLTQITSILHTKHIHERHREPEEAPTFFLILSTIPTAIILLLLPFIIASKELLVRFLSDFVSVIVNNLKNRRAARSAVELAVAERGTVETGNFLAVSCEQAFEFKSYSFFSLFILWEEL